MERLRDLGPEVRAEIVGGILGIDGEASGMVERERIEVVVSEDLPQGGDGLVILKHDECVRRDRAGALPQIDDDLPPAMSLE